MKTVFIFLATVFSLQSAKAASMIRLFDGMNARCSEKSDLGNKAQKIIVSNNKLNADKLNLEVSFFECSQKNNNFILEPKSLEEMSTSDLQVYQPQLLLVVDETELASSVDLDQNLAKQNITVNLPQVQTSQSIDVFVRVLEKNIDGSGYQTFGPFRLQK